MTFAILTYYRRLQISERILGKPLGVQFSASHIPTYLIYTSLFLSYGRRLVYITRKYRYIRYTYSVT